MPGNEDERERHEGLRLDLPLQLDQESHALWEV